MRDKELRDNLAAVLLRLSIALPLPLVGLVSGGSSAITVLVILYVGLLIGGAWAALHLGVNAFRAEFRDRAWEYLFTAPQPAWRLWLDKLAARLLLLLLPAVLVLLLSWILGRLEPGLPQMMAAKSALADSTWVFPRLALLMGLGFLVSPFDWGSYRPALPFLLPLGLGVWGFFSARLASRLGLSAGWRHPLTYLPEAILLLLFLLRWHGLRQGASLRLPGSALWGRRPGGIVPTPVFSRRKRRGLVILEAARLWRGELFSLMLLGAGLVLMFRNTHIGGVPVRIWVPMLVGQLVLIRGFSHGFNLFEREFRDQSLEYLLSAPRPFLGIVAVKVAARMLVQAPMVLAYFVLALGQPSDLPLSLAPLLMLLDPRFFLVWYLLIFATGVFMSPFAPRNLHALVSLAALYSLVLPVIALFRLISLPAGAGGNSWPSILCAIGGMLPAVAVLGSAFFSVARRFDLASGDRYSQIYGLRTLVPLLLLSVASGLFLILR